MLGALPSGGGSREQLTSRCAATAASAAAARSAADCRADCRADDEEDDDEEEDEEENHAPAPPPLEAGASLASPAGALRFFVSCFMDATGSGACGPNSQSQPMREHRRHAKPWPPSVSSHLT